LRKAHPFIVFSFVFIGIYLQLACLPLRAQNKEKNADKNVLLITIDTLRADRLGCYGSVHSKTPYIDALAARSVLFARAFAHTSTTLPSHTNILLGTTPLYHGVHDNYNFKVGEEYVTLAEYLKGEGYSTGAFIGAFPLDSRFGLSQGFDFYDGDFGLTASGRVKETERRAETVIEKALSWLDRQVSPWFLWVHCYDPHDPYEPPEPYASRYAGSPYDGEVAYVDSALERLFQYLERKGFFDDTVIVFTGDHGESLGEHGETTHGAFAYNSTIWIPLFVFVPGIKPLTVPQNVSHIDIFPTICDALKMEKPSFLQGVSLLPAMKGRKLRKRSLYFESLLPYYDLGWAPIRGFIQGSEKFIDSPIPELYDLEKDFDETDNIAPQNNLDDRRKQLDQILRTQESEGGAKAQRGIDREALEKLKSLGYIGDSFGQREKIFSAEEDVKVLLPYHNRAGDALKLWKEGKAEEGIRRLQEVIKEKNGISSAYSNLATIFRAQGKLESAIQVLRAGLESIPESYMIFSSLMDYLFEAGRWNEVIGAFEGQSFKQFDFDPVVWNMVGAAYSNIGDFEKALQFCERAVSIDGKFTLSYTNLGRIHFNIFNRTTSPEALQEALLNYNKALELDPKIAGAHDGLGLIYMYQGNYAEAIDHLERAIRLQPGLDHVLYNLGLAYLKTGDKAKALSCFERFKKSQSFRNLSAVEKKRVEDYILQCQSNT
jgi:arylsulfatase A-like enzyme/Tfp pilus assembly protein PilF